MKKEAFIQTYKIDRKQTDSLKWDALQERFGSADLLPLWVADADFSTDNLVKDKVIERIQHGAFGYSITPKDYVETYQGWQNRHEGTQFKEEWLTFSPGVVQSLFDIVACFTEEGNQIAIQPPVYYPFYHCINDQNRRLVELPLVNQNEHYSMDFDALEQTFKEQDIKLFILCSPHNPVSRVWTKEELTHFYQLCKTYDVRVISDEIHSDLVFAPNKFISSITVAEEVGFEKLIVCNSPSKTFNFAGLLHSHLWIPDEKSRLTFQKWSTIHRHTEQSLIGVTAAKAAYGYSDEWHQAFLDTIESNYQLVAETVAKELPGVSLSPLQGTYLAWMNIESLLQHESIKDFIQEKAKLAIDYGEWFSPKYRHHIRLNLATTPEIVSQALAQIVSATKAGKEQRNHE